MGNTNKRATIRLGFVFGTQDIDAETGAVVADKVVNVWGGSYTNLDMEEAVMLEAKLNEALGSEMLELMGKAMTVAADLGMETVLGLPPGTDVSGAIEAVRSGGDKKEAPGQIR